MSTADTPCTSTSSDVLFSENDEPSKDNTCSTNECSKNSETNSGELSSLPIQAEVESNFPSHIDTASSRDVDDQRGLPMCSQPSTFHASDTSFQTGIQLPLTESTDHGETNATQRLESSTLLTSTDTLQNSDPCDVNNSSSMRTEFSSAAKSSEEADAITTDTHLNSENKLATTPITKTNSTETSSIANADNIDGRSKVHSLNSKLSCLPTDRVSRQDNMELQGQIVDAEKPNQESVNENSSHQTVEFLNNVWCSYGYSMCNNCNLKSSNADFLTSHKQGCTTPSTMVYPSTKDHVEIKLECQENNLLCATCRLHCDEKCFKEHITWHLFREPYKCIIDNCSVHSKNLVEYIEHKNKYHYQKQLFVGFKGTKKASAMISSLRESSSLIFMGYLISPNRLKMLLEGRVRAGLYKKQTSIGNQTETKNEVSSLNTQLTVTSSQNVISASNSGGKISSTLHTSHSPTSPTKPLMNQAALQNLRQKYAAATKDKQKTQMTVIQTHPSSAESSNRLLKNLLFADKKASSNKNSTLSQESSFCSTSSDSSLISSTPHLKNLLESKDGAQSSPVLAVSPYSSTYSDASSSSSSPTMPDLISPSSTEPQKKHLLENTQAMTGSSVISVASSLTSSIHETSVSSLSPIMAVSPALSILPPSSPKPDQHVPSPQPPLPSGTSLHVALQSRNNTLPAVNVHGQLFTVTGLFVAPSNGRNNAAVKAPQNLSKSKPIVIEDDDDVSIVEKPESHSILTTTSNNTPSSSGRQFSNKIIHESDIGAPTQGIVAQRSQKSNVKKTNETVSLSDSIVIDADDDDNDSYVYTMEKTVKTYRFQYLSPSFYRCLPCCKAYVVPKTLYLHLWKHVESDFQIDKKVARHPLPVEIQHHLERSVGKLKVLASKFQETLNVRLDITVDSHTCVMSIDICGDVMSAGRKEFLNIKQHVVAVCGARDITDLVTQEMMLKHAKQQDLKTISYYCSYLPSAKTNKLKCGVCHAFFEMDNFSTDHIWLHLSRCSSNKKPITNAMQYFLKKMKRIPKASARIVHGTIQIIFALHNSGRSVSTYYEIHKRNVTEEPVKIKSYVSEFIYPDEVSKPGMGTKSPSSTNCISKPSADEVLVISDEDNVVESDSEATGCEEIVSVDSVPPTSVVESSQPELLLTCDNVETDTVVERIEERKNENSRSVSISEEKVTAPEQNISKEKNLLELANNGNKFTNEPREPTNELTIAKQTHSSCINIGNVAGEDGQVVNVTPVSQLKNSLQDSTNDKSVSFNTNNVNKINDNENPLQGRIPCDNDVMARDYMPLSDNDQNISSNDSEVPEQSDSDQNYDIKPLHKLNGFYRCGFHGCLYSFLFSEILTQHMLDRHKGVQCFMCFLCGKVFIKAELLSSHLKYDHITKEQQRSRQQVLLQCSVPDCRYSTNSLKSYLKHYSDLHSSLNVFTCSHCGTDFNTIEMFNSHLVMFLNKVVLCTYCDARSFHRSVIHEHITNSHKDCPKNIGVVSYFTCGQSNLAAGLIPDPSQVPSITATPVTEATTGVETSDHSSANVPLPVAYSTTSLHDNQPTHPMNTNSVPLDTSLVLSNQEQPIADSCLTTSPGNQTPVVNRNLQSNVGEGSGQFDSFGISEPIKPSIIHATGDLSAASDTESAPSSPVTLSSEELPMEQNQQESVSDSSMFDPSLPFCLNKVSSDKVISHCCSFGSDWLHSLLEIFIRESLTCEICDFVPTASVDELRNKIQLHVHILNHLNLNVHKCTSCSFECLLCDELQEHSKEFHDATIIISSFNVVYKSIQDFTTAFQSVIKIKPEQKSTSKKKVISYVKKIAKRQKQDSASKKQQEVGSDKNQKQECATTVNVNDIQETTQEPCEKQEKSKNHIHQQKSIEKPTNNDRQKLKKKDSLKSNTTTKQKQEKLNLKIFQKQKQESVGKRTYGDQQKLNPQKSPKPSTTVKQPEKQNLKSLKKQKIVRQKGWRKPLKSSIIKRRSKRKQNLSKFFPTPETNSKRDETMNEMSKKGMSSFKCNICSFKSATEKGMSLHITKANHQRTAKCNKCNKVVSGVDTVKTHLKYYHKIPPNKITFPEMYTLTPKSDLWTIVANTTSETKIKSSPDSQTSQTTSNTSLSKTSFSSPKQISESSIKTPPATTSSHSAPNSQNKPTTVDSNDRSYSICCSACEFSCKTFSLLDEHISSSHPGSEVKCKICELSVLFKSVTDLYCKHHCPTHKSLKFLYELCTKSSTAKESQSKKLLKAKTDGDRSSNSSKPEKNSSLPKSQHPVKPQTDSTSGAPSHFFKCFRCSFKCKMLSEMDEHIEEDHPKSQVACGHCDRYVCTSVKELFCKHHMKEHAKLTFSYTLKSGKNRKPQKDAEHNKETKKPWEAFTCEKCEFKCKTLFEMDGHVKEKHGISKAYCTYCVDHPGFSSLSVLYNDHHLKSHKNKLLSYSISKPSISRRSNSSKREEERQSNAKPDYAATTTPNSSTDIFACKLCTFRCAKLNTLDNHITSDHFDAKLTCSHCKNNKTFPSVTNLLIVHHNKEHESLPFTYKFLGQSDTETNDGNDTTQSHQPSSSNQDNNSAHANTIPHTRKKKRKKNRDQRQKFKPVPKRKCTVSYYKQFFSSSESDDDSDGSIFSDGEDDSDDHLSEDYPDNDSGYDNESLLSDRTQISLRSEQTQPKVSKSNKNASSSKLLSSDDEIESNVEKIPQNVLVDNSRIAKKNSESKYISKENKSDVESIAEDISVNEDESVPDEVEKTTSSLKRLLNDDSMDVEEGRDGAKRFQCLFCDKVYKVKYSLIYHIGVHFRYKPYRCGICNAGGWTGSCAAQSHHNSYHPSQKLKTVFTEDEEVTSFIAFGYKNRNKRPGPKMKFRCTRCSFRCPEMNMMKRHFEAHTDKTGVPLEGSFEEIGNGNDQGSNEVHSTDSNKQHFDDGDSDNSMESSSTRTSEGGSKRKVDRLSSHMFKKTYHANSHQMFYSCTECPYRTSDVKNVEKHYQLYHCAGSKSDQALADQQNTDLEGSSEKSPTNSTKFSCIICKDKWNTIYDLQEHINIHHPGLKVRCRLCGEEKQTIKLLYSSHFYLRHKNASFQYSFVKYDVSSTSGDIGTTSEKRHEASTSASHNFYSCTFCGKQYAKANYTRFAEHLAVRHYNYMPYKCPHCETRTYHKSDLHAHIRRTHKILHVSNLVGDVDEDKQRQIDDIVRRQTTPSKASHAPQTARKRFFSKSAYSSGEISRQSPSKSSAKRSPEANNDKYVEVYDSDQQRIMFACSAEGCEFRAKLRKATLTHYRWKHKDKPKTLKCPHCLFTNKFNFILNRHIKRMHPDVNSEIEDAEESSACSADDAEVYIDKDLKTEPDSPPDSGLNFCCHLCNFKTHDMGDFQEHVLSPHNDENYASSVVSELAEADDEGGRTDTPTPTIESIESVGQVEEECKFCCFKAATSEAILKHVIKVHIQECKAEAVQKRTNSSVQENNEQVGNEFDTAEKAVTSTTTADEGATNIFKCPFCIFSSEHRDLVNHIVKVHNNTISQGSAAESISSESERDLTTPVNDEVSFYDVNLNPDLRLTDVMAIASNEFDSLLESYNVHTLDLTLLSEKRVKSVISAYASDSDSDSDLDIDRMKGRKRIYNSDVDEELTVATKRARLSKACKPHQNSIRWLFTQSVGGGDDTFEEDLFVEVYFDEEEQLVDCIREFIFVGDGLKNDYFLNSFADGYSVNSNRHYNSIAAMRIDAHFAEIADDVNGDKEEVEKMKAHFAEIVQDIDPDWEGD